MAAFTSTQAGDWSDTATWGGSGPPGDGDTSTVDHAVAVDANTEVGASGAEGTVAILVDATSGKTGALTVNNGIQLRVNGDLVLANSVLTLQPNGNYQFGNGGSSQVYKLQIGSTISQTSARVVLAGTSGNRITIDKESGAGNGIITRSLNHTSAFAGLTGDYVDFLDIGKSTAGFGSDAINLKLSGANQEFHLNHFTFTRCGRSRLEGALNSNNINLQYGKIRDKIYTDAVVDIHIFASAKTTGERIFKHVGMRSGWLAFQTSVAGYEIEDISFRRIQDLSLSEFTPHASVQGLFQAVTDTLTTSEIGVVGDEIRDVVLFSSTNSQAGGPWSGTGLNSSAGTILYEDFVAQSTFPEEDPDAFSGAATGSGGPWTYKVSRWVTTPVNGRGLPGMNGMSMHSSSKTKAIIEHCTAATQDSLSPTPRGFFAFNYGVDAIGTTDMIKSFKSNLTVAPGPTSTYGYGLLHYYSSNVAAGGNTGFGTAANTSTTTVLNCTGKGWQTGSTSNFSACGAKVVITVSGTGDPPVGEIRDIASNTAASLTVSTPFTAAPDSGTCEFKIIVPDTILAGSTSKNHWFNTRNGTVYDETGRNGVSKLGYHEMCITDPSTIGADDVDLGTGSNWATQGPAFKDPTRGVHNFSSRFLLAKGLVTDPASWSGSSVSYTKGQRVKHTTSSANWYNGESLFYRCKTDHTSGSTTEPGVGASWFANWELDIIEVMDDACAAGSTTTDSELGLTSVSYPIACRAWVADGFQPTNEALRNAAHDGTTPGAVEMAESGGVVPILQGLSGNLGTLSGNLQ